MSSRLYVGNLAYSTTKESLQALFAADGRQVTDVHIVMDRATGQPRGFAFVELGSPDQAKQAITALDGKELDGRRLRVTEARERTPGGFGGPGRGPGGGFGDRPPPRREFGGGPGGGPGGGYAPRREGAGGFGGDRPRRDFGGPPPGGSVPPQRTDRGRGDRGERRARDERYERRRDRDAEEE